MTTKMTAPNISQLLKDLQTFLDAPENTYTGRRDVEHSYRDEPLKQIRARIDDAVDEMSDKPQAPERAVKVVITLGADDHKAALRSLDNYVRMAEREYEGKAFSTTSGGYDTGYDVRVTERPEQTHDNYVAELNAYLDAICSKAIRVGNR